MKRLLIAGLLIIAFLLGMVVAYANPSWLGTQEIWNRIFDSTNNKLTIRGV